jgi:Protein of unknown function (DUF3551)
MRLPILTLLFVAATSAGETAASAQSAGSYPWCAIYYTIDSNGTPSCSFDTRQQCMETISGIGGFCVENQYYHGAAVPAPRRTHVARAHKHTSTHP